MVATLSQRGQDWTGLCTQHLSSISAGAIEESTMKVVEFRTKAQFHLVEASISSRVSGGRPKDGNRTCESVFLFDEWYKGNVPGRTLPGWKVKPNKIK